MGGYEPDPELIERYARVLVDFALGGGEGIKRGDVVLVVGPENAKPLFTAVCRAVWRSGGHVLRVYEPAEDTVEQRSRDFYELASDEQLDFFPERYYRGELDQMDHLVAITSPVNPHGLEGVPAEKIMRHNQAHMPLMDWQQAKEGAGQLTWTVGLYGTEAMAAEAGLSLKDYWSQIASACFLDDPDPIARWREVTAQIDEHSAYLNSLPIDRLHIEGEDADLWLTLGEHRRWLGGGGRNIPSYEIFTSPDWRGTEGWIRFSEPLYTYGSLIKGAELQFRDGRVVSARATQREDLLREMVAVENADKVGEFSLTDARLSRISHFMAHTLFDENMGGPFGNTHIAVGLSYRSCYDGDETTVSEEEWDRLGYNRSSVHTDIVSTTDRTVTAVLKDGSQRVIYAGGQFQHG
ncbi:MAG TPA: aminopeptidase [Solirubrobacteraceae bacterium]|nr:aminopeptidase [Solirubrobacteraceae bacterium]